MLAIFGFQDSAKVVADKLSELGSKITGEEKKNYKVQQKLDSKEQFLIYQCESQIFNKILKTAIAKEEWGILVKTYDDGNKTKKVRLQILLRLFEFLTMEDGETTSDYFDKIQECVLWRSWDLVEITSHISISDQHVMDKIMRTLPPRFDHVVVAIEETKDLQTMEIEELQHLLEAHDYRINERRHIKGQALQARSGYKGKNKGRKKRHKKKLDHKSNDSGDSTKAKDQKVNASSSGRKEWKFDKKVVL